MAAVYLTGATGYIGSRLAAELARRGHSVRALKRPNGDALNSLTYREDVAGCDTLVHLVGVAHPSPAKAAEFRTIDLRSALEAIAAARYARVRHLIYVSVAHPAPVMRAYIAARCEAEQAIQESGLQATILRPWYVLGPGHRWAYGVLPLYWLLERIPATRKASRRLGLLKIGEMVQALAGVVELGPGGHRVLEVPQIRALAASERRRAFTKASCGADIHVEG